MSSLSRVAFTATCFLFIIGCSKAKEAPTPAPAPSPVAQPVVQNTGEKHETGDKRALCRTCILESHHRNCSHDYVVANPHKKDNTTIGCESLPRAAERDACNTLLSCINKHHCATNFEGTKPGDNSPAGCYCGKAKGDECVKGGGIEGVCAAEYHAAAIASTDGPAKNAKEEAFGAFIGFHAFAGDTPIGMADNIVACAVDSPCPVCLEL